jgi:hypothetical protein
MQERLQGVTIGSWLDPHKEISYHVLDKGKHC